MPDPTRPALGPNRAAPDRTCRSGCPAATCRAINRAILSVAACAALAACSLAPPHVRPPLPTAAEFASEHAPNPAGGVSAPTLERTRFIADARLEALIAAALDRNRDLAAALARIEEARGSYRVQRADRVPSARLDAEASRSQSVTTGFGAGFPAAADGAQDMDNRSAAVVVPAFELDFFGRVRSLTAAARARFLATADAAQALGLALVREVADAYLRTLEARARIALAERTVESRREEMTLAEQRLEAGVISALELAQTETLLRQAETELAALRYAEAQSANALALLVGGPLDRELPAGAPLGEQVSDAPLRAGLPSELLAARPDVRAAEERLRAARADIGAARAAFFPSIVLTASSGYASTELGELFEADGHTWSFGPTLSVPIFDFGRRRGNLDAARAREQLAIADYELAIQTAFQEVANALAGRRYLAEQVEAQALGTAAQRRLAELARQRYQEGVISYLEVLDAERNLFAAEQALLEARRAQATNLIALYVALGGGLR